MKPILTIIFVLTATILRSQSNQLAQGFYIVDKNIEIEAKKFQFVDTGVLKKSMKIGVFWDGRNSFKHYDDESALDCFTVSSLNGDTISIIGYMIGMLGYGFSLKIYEDSYVIAPYAISDGDIYLSGPNENTYTNHVILPSIVHQVRLSKKPTFKEGESIAGHVRLKSVPFYYKDLEGKFVIEVNAYFKTAPLKRDE